MPYLLPDDRFAVFFSPKSAGTTVRAFMYEIENGFPFREDRIQGRPRDANSLARNRPFRQAMKDYDLADYFRVAIIRDPVRRLMSCWSNRVMHYGELDENRLGLELERLDLPMRPDFSDFVRYLDGYRKVSRSIHRHTLPQQVFLGADKGYFHRVFKIETLHLFEGFVQDRFGVHCEMPRLQSGGPKMTVSEIDPAVHDLVNQAVSEDIGYSWEMGYRPIGG